MQVTSSLARANSIKNDDFKVDINRLIVNVASDDLDTDLEFAITDGIKVLKVNEDVQIREVWSTIDDLMEEADNRVLLYIRDAIECGHNGILLKTVDSDIIIILLGFMEKLLECNSDIKMWVKFNSGVNEKLIDMNTTFKELGGEIAYGIMFFHCFSGCDATTAFFKKSKNVLFKSWKCYPQRTALSKVFKALTFYPSAETYKSSLPTIYEFISHDYTDEIVQLNIVRFNLYLRFRSLRELPPSEHALYRHIKNVYRLYSTMAGRKIPLLRLQWTGLQILIGKYSTILLPHANTLNLHYPM